MADTDKRFCYYLNESMHEEGRGFRPVIVYEGEVGYHQQGGDPTNPDDPYPWYWGHCFEAALTICQKANARLGLSPEEAQAIVDSSFRASFV